MLLHLKNENKNKNEQITVKSNPFKQFQLLSEDKNLAKSPIN